MYPCFRCKRDLGLGDVVCDYPEPAIEMGIFPPEIADTYREIMRRVDNGEDNISIDIPLTSERLMFHVRYKTDYDENGKAVKAHGSAVLI